MVDPGNQRTVRVALDSERKPYIQLTVAALDQVCQLLQSHAISFRVDPHTVSIDHKPAVAWIWIHKNADPARIQTVLDNAA